MRHILSILLENEAGALSRVSGLFSARGYNIEALSVAATDDPTLSRMTLVTTGGDKVIEQITKQLNKLVDVVRLVDVTDDEHIEREMMLIKISAPRNSSASDSVGDLRAEAHRLIEDFSGHVLDTTDESYTVELTGPSSKLDGFIDAIGISNVIEVVRSGPAAIGRGQRILPAA